MLTTTTNHLRWMIRRDLEEVLAIEKECFKRPWSESDWLDHLRKTHIIAQVIEDSATFAIKGYIIYELFKTELKVIRFAVKPSAQNQGVASHMIKHLINKLYAQKARKLISVVVPERRLAAQLLLKKLGFRCTEVLKGRKTTAYFFVKTKVEPIESRLTPYFEELPLL